MNIGPAHFLAGALGAGLLVAAIANEHPLGLVVSILTGDESRRGTIYTPPPRGTATLGWAAGALTLGGAGAVNDPAGPAMLVPIGQGSHRLAPAAAAGFAAWQRAFGRSIPVTDSYRPYAEQARQHRASPDRFASPDKSAHVDGTAVDVNLGALESNGADATYRRLKAAGTATGWHFVGRSGPMHASHGAPR